MNEFEEYWELLSPTPKRSLLDSILDSLKVGPHRIEYDLRQEHTRSIITFEHKLTEGIDPFKGHSFTLTHNEPLTLVKVRIYQDETLLYTRRLRVEIPPGDTITLPEVDMVKSLLRRI